MESIRELTEQVLGLWLAIVGISAVFGVLFTVGSSLSHRKRQKSSPDQGGRAA